MYLLFVLFRTELHYCSVVLQGTKPLLGTDGELYTQGLTDLDTRCQKYYKAGARFSKW